MFDFANMMNAGRDKTATGPKSFAPMVANSPAAGRCFSLTASMPFAESDEKQVAQAGWMDSANKALAEYPVFFVGGEDNASTSLPV
jgi:hypothetical protein